ncbi:MAG: CPBP family intramembrane glutamic endopeptidase [Terriglobales bacterium]|jgi:membrane protease YdiL (CAAX protease family)
MQNASPAAIVVLVGELIPAAVFGWAGERVGQAWARWPRSLRTVVPVVCALPYVVISSLHQMFSWRWCTLYAALPVAIAYLLGQAAVADPDQRGNWRDAIILLTLGLAVDLRWFEPAWPNGLAGWGKLLLVDAALYGFVVMRQLSGTGFDFHFRASDWKTGLRELVCFAPLVLAGGLALGFLHPHAHALRLSMIPTWIYIFIFVAVPEELFFRAWVQNLLERRVGRRIALAVTALLFGLSHFNKRSSQFNWRYVLLASLAGVFYGRAWRERRRVPASAITHASVDAIWSFWF